MTVSTQNLAPSSRPTPTSSSRSAATCMRTPSSGATSSAPPSGSPSGCSGRACSPSCCPAPGLSATSGGRGRAARGRAARRPRRAAAAGRERPAPGARPWPASRHACGHDVHTTAVLGAGLALADLDAVGRLPGRVRLIFQPAEEVTPGGALDVIAAGGLDGVDRAYALHCDPGNDVGTVATAARARSRRPRTHVHVRLHGAGGHTSRPHLTEDLVFALAAGRHPGAGDPDPPARPAGRGRHGLGPDRRGRGVQRHPARAARSQGTLRCLDADGLGAGRRAGHRGRPRGRRARTASGPR